MGACLYDEALVAKIKNWTESTNIHVYGPNEEARLLEVIADETKDSPIQLPLLSISRVGGYDILNANRKIPINTYPIGDIKYVLISFFIIAHIIYLPPCQ